MDIGFLPIDLRRWDQAHGELLAIGLWSDVRPLRGAPGLLDWRLCGKLSAWIEAGRLAGADGEQTLLPAGRRLPWRSILVFGLGEVAAFHEDKTRAVLGRLAESMRGLHLRRLAVAVPGRDNDRLSPRRAYEVTLEALAGASVDELVFVDGPAALKEMAELARRRAEPAGAA